MRVVSETELIRELTSIANPTPRVVASGNFATPRHLLSILDRAVESYRLFVLNAQPPLPSRPGVVFETPFIGPGMRRHPDLAYLPMRLSLVPHLFERARPPDILLLNTSAPYFGVVSLGIEVNILVSALLHIRRHGGLVVAQLNPRMPYTFGDAEIRSEYIDLAIEAEEELPSPSCGPTATSRRHRRQRRSAGTRRCNAPARDRRDPRLARSTRLSDGSDSPSGRR